MTEAVRFTSLKPEPGSQVRLLGVREPLKWQTSPEGVTTLDVPAAVVKSPPCHHAFVFMLTRSDENSSR
jgi:hypothetical protein